MKEVCAVHVVPGYVVTRVDQDLHQLLYLGVLLDTL
jgi:hypothetical protein